MREVYWPDDPNATEALCLRIDHVHKPELGCWELRSIKERLKEVEEGRRENTYVSQLQK